MKCPYCGKEAKVEQYVLHNAENYGKSVKARTRCCGALIIVTAKTIFSCSEAEQKGKDDWGH